MNILHTYANGFDPSVEFWAYRVATWEFELDEFGVTTEWFFRRCRDLAANGANFALTGDDCHSLFHRLASWLGNIALNGANVEAASVARDLFGLAIRLDSAYQSRWYWREFMSAHRIREALKPHHVQTQIMQDVHTYLLEMFREFLASHDPEVVAGGLVGLDWIWGEEKKEILRDFLATDPGEELTSLANAAMESNLW